MRSREGGPGPGLPGPGEGVLGEVGAEHVLPVSCQHCSWLSLPGVQPRGRRDGAGAHGAMDGRESGRFLQEEVAEETEGVILLPSCRRPASVPLLGLEPAGAPRGPCTLPNPPRKAPRRYRRLPRPKRRGGRWMAAGSLCLLFTPLSGFVLAVAVRRALPAARPFPSQRGSCRQRPSGWEVCPGLRQLNRSRSAGLALGDEVWC